jgi:hypothetical protein
VSVTFSTGCSEDIGISDGTRCARSGGLSLPTTGEAWIKTVISEQVSGIKLKAYPDDPKLQVLPLSLHKLAASR